MFYILRDSLIQNLEKMAFRERHAIFSFFLKGYQLMPFTKHVTSGIFLFNSLFDYIDYKRIK